MNLVSSLVMAMAIVYSVCSMGTNSGAYTTLEPPIWCVAKPNADDTALQAAIDFCCQKGGVACDPIYKGGACYEPENRVGHASYAMNVYYQQQGRYAWNCDFHGIGMLAVTNPGFEACNYIDE